MLGNGGIQPIHMLFFLFQFLSIIFLRYDVPACGCRVPFLYVVLVSLLSLLMLLMDVYLWSLVGADYTDMYTYDWRLGFGRESAFGVPIRIDCLFPTIRRPVPIFGPGGLLSVK